MKILQYVIWYVILSALGVFSLFNLGCTSMELAKHPPTRGPLKGDIEFNDDGSTKKVSLDSAGGSASDIYYEKNIQYGQDGKPLSNHTVLTSDVSSVVQTHGDVVLRQSQQDLASALAVIRETTSTISTLASTAVNLQGQLQALKPPPSTQPSRMEQLLEAWAAKNGIEIPK